MRHLCTGCGEEFHNSLPQCSKCGGPVFAVSKRFETVSLNEQEAPPSLLSREIAVEQLEAEAGPGEAGGRPGEHWDSSTDNSGDSKVPAQEDFFERAKRATRQRTEQRELFERGEERTEESKEEKSEDKKRAEEIQRRLARSRGKTRKRPGGLTGRVFSSGGGGGAGHDYEIPDERPLWQKVMLGLLFFGMFAYGTYLIMGTP